MVFWHRTDRNA